MAEIPGWELKVRFVVYGADCDPDHLTRVLGVQPSKTWRVGECARAGASPARDAGWLLESDLPARASLDEHLRSLLARLPPTLPGAPGLGGKQEAGFCVAVYGRDGFPAVTFDLEVLCRVVGLGAYIDVDIYALPSHSSSPVVE